MCYLIIIDGAITPTNLLAVRDSLLHPTTNFVNYVIKTTCVVMEETGFLFSCFCAPVFPNVPSQPGMPCQGEDREYFFSFLIPVSKKPTSPAYIYNEIAQTHPDHDDCVTKITTIVLIIVVSAFVLWLV